MVNDETFIKYIIAEYSNEIIGFATFFFSYYSWTGKAIYLDDLYVKEDHRGKNVGNLLLDHVMQLGKAQNCVKMK